MNKLVKIYVNDVGDEICPYCGEIVFGNLYSGEAVQEIHMLRHEVQKHKVILKNIIF